MYAKIIPIILAWFSQHFVSFPKTGGEETMNKVSYPRTGTLSKSALEAVSR